MIDEVEIEVKAVATYNNKVFDINITHTLSDRAYTEISEMIEQKLARNGVFK